MSRLIARVAQHPDAALEAITAARATARERVWNWAGAPVQDGQVVIDLDATLVPAHSEKQDATRGWKKTFGFHPLLGFVDYGPAGHGPAGHGPGGHGGGGEPAAELLRPGKAGSNAADRIAVLDAALAQLPAPWRRPDAEGRIRVLVRTGAAGATTAFAARLAELGLEFSVGASFAHLDATPPWHCSLDRRGPRRIERASPAPPSAEQMWASRSSPATAPGSPRPPDCSTWPDGRPAPGLSCAGNGRAPARSCASPTPTGCV